MSPKDLLEKVSPSCQVIGRAGSLGTQLTKIKRQNTKSTGLVARARSLPATEREPPGSSERSNADHNYYNN